LEDRDLDWMAKLDWSQHKLVASKTVSDRMPLATAVSRLAEYAAGPVWPYEIPHFLSLAGNPSPGDWIIAEQAFDAKGRPTSLHHDHLPLALEHARRLKVALASRDAVTRQEWEAIDLAGLAVWAEGEGARRMWALLAPLFADLAFRNPAVKTFARPIGGGDPQPVPRDAWQIDPELAIVRLAACGFDPQRPFSQDAFPTHRLFVAKDLGLDAAFQEAARDNYIPHAAIEHTCTRTIDEAEPSLAIQRAFLHALMLQHPGWSRGRFQKAIEDKYGIRFPERRHKRFRKSILDADASLSDKLTRTGPKPE